MTESGLSDRRQLLRELTWRFYHWLRLHQKHSALKEWETKFLSKKTSVKLKQKRSRKAKNKNLRLIYEMYWNDNYATKHIRNLLFNEFQGWMLSINGIMCASDDCEGVSGFVIPVYGDFSPHFYKEIIFSGDKLKSWANEYEMEQELEKALR